jgi:hypothetical protein
MGTMRLPDSAHTSRPWRIHELTPDFRLEDVWALPTPGGPDDFPRLVQQFASGDPSQRSTGPTRVLWAIRWKIGGLLGWDEPDAGVGSRVPTLRERLPEDLREAPSGPTFDALPFTSLYLLDNEFAAEIANRTVHGVLHLGWVPNDTGGYRGQMAVLVKPNGLLGSLYMAAIKPFRHLLVYPALMRTLERDWRSLKQSVANDSYVLGVQRHCLPGLPQRELHDVRARLRHDDGEDVLPARVDDVVAGDRIGVVAVRDHAQRLGQLHQHPLVAGRARLAQPDHRTTVFAGLHHQLARHFNDSRSS